MPVVELTEPVTPRPNTIYVQPANKCMIVQDGVLKLIRRTQQLNVAIDHFFESLAEDRGSRAIGVILSGSGTDGTAGLRAIKAAGGLTFAQSEASAKFDSMPRSAIRAGFVDAALPPREIAQEIGRVADHPYIRQRMADGEDVKTRKKTHPKADDLGRIFLSLRKQMGVNFSSYKHATLLRRIQRRTALHRMEKLSRYSKFLRDNQQEIEALFDDLLINVTHFFRDERMFRELKKRFLPALLKNKKENQRRTLRAWVPGCATGEEVYSLAICILETLGRRGSNMNIQIFGTDLSESTIEHARAGVYSSTIEKDVSPLRLKRFFARRDGFYQINRNVRDLCTFARQNITADPPFSRLDLISCRNVLIYLSPQLHRRCIPQFHYALNPGGYLILGPAESVGLYHKLFEPVDRNNRIYARRNVPTARLVDLVSYRGYEFPETEASLTSSGLDTQLLEITDRIMLSAYAPAAVVIDDALHIEQFRGRTDDYLEQMPGPATRNLLQLVRPSMVADLRAAVDRAIKTGKPARKERALVKFDGKTREVNIEVVPFKLPASDKSGLLVIFDETTKGARPGAIARGIWQDREATRDERHAKGIKRIAVRRSGVAFKERRVAIDERRARDGEGGIAIDQRGIDHAER
jgi:two-component system CheB/CheR fusion protein